MKYRKIGLMSLGHLVTDINQGALPALLPFFIAVYDLSYAAAATIVFAANMASSVVQPVFGLVSDRSSKPWLLPCGMLMAGWGLCLTGVLPGYGWVVVLAILSGIGVAAFHPEAARRVHFAAGDKQGFAMSIFGIGGTLGFAVGPLLVTMALLKWGLHGTLVLCLPVTFVALMTISHLSSETLSEEQAQDANRLSETNSGEDQWGPFIRLTGVVIGRSIIFYGLNTFIPIYWIQQLHASKSAGAAALTVFAVSGIAGSLLGGRLADRYGQKSVLLAGFTSLIFLLPLLLWVDGLVWPTVVLVAIGLVLYATYSPSIVLGQKYLSRRVGFSSGITLGLAVAIGGGATPFIGMVADHHGLATAMISLTGLPILVVILALTLPKAKAPAA